MGFNVKRIQLNIGERLTFSETCAACRILSGRVEVYAVDLTAGGSRMFLRPKVEGQAVFALRDEFQTVELSLLVQEPVELVLYSYSDLQKLCAGETDSEGLTVDGLKTLMREWFFDLLQVEWVRFMESHRDEFVVQWPEGAFLKSATAADLLKVFTEHQNVLALLCIGRFHAKKKFFEKRLEQRSLKQAQLLRASFNILGGSDDGSDYSVAANTAYSRLVNRVVHFYGMKDMDLSVPDYLTKRFQDKHLLQYVIRRGNLRFRKVRLSDNWFRQDSGVLFVCHDDKWSLALPKDSSHYVLWHGDDTGEPLTEEVAATLTEEALICYPGFNSGKVSIKEFIKFLFRTTWQNDWLFIVAVSVVMGFLPLLTPIITDTIFGDVIPNRDYGSLATITQVMLVSGLVTAVLTVVRSLTVMRLDTHLGMMVEAAVMSRLLNLPTDFFRHISVGEITKRLLSIIDMKNLFTGQLVSGLFNFLFGLWSLALMFYYSGKLTCIAVGIWAVYLLLQGLNLCKFPTKQKELMKYGNEQTGLTVELINNLAKFRSRGGTEQVFYLWSQKFSASWRKNLEIRWINNRTVLLNTALPLVLMLVLYCFAAQGIADGDADAIDVTTFMAFNAAYTGFNGALVTFLPEVVQLMSLPAYWQNIEPLLREEEETGDDRAEAEELSGEIELRRVAFRYDEDSPEVLKDVNLHIKQGEKVAFVGGSGCGKSTLVRLLLGFEKPTKGIICYDGKDMETFNATSIRRQMGVVMQSSKLLMAPILDNIVGMSNMTVDDAWAAAQIAAVDKDIKEMPMGMHTYINDTSGNISGGQRQRLLLARAVVNKPKILILDEATSALDNVTQEAVTKNLRDLHCTQIVIAHRLSTLRDVDKIFVLDKGVVAESGTYEELMALGGLFSQLAKRQIS